MTTINEVPEADLERDRLRDWLDDHDIRMTIAHDKVTRLKVKLVKTEAKATELRGQIEMANAEAVELQRAYDRGLGDYNELGGSHIDDMEKP